MAAVLANPALRKFNEAILNISVFDWINLWILVDILHAPVVLSETQEVVNTEEQKKAAEAELRATKDHEEPSNQFGRPSNMNGESSLD